MYLHFIATVLRVTLPFNVRKFRSFMSQFLGSCILPKYVCPGGPWVRLYLTRTMCLLLVRLESAYSLVRGMVQEIVWGLVQGMVRELVWGMVWKMVQSFIREIIWQMVWVLVQGNGLRSEESFGDQFSVFESSHQKSVSLLPSANGPRPFTFFKCETN